MVLKPLAISLDSLKGKRIVTTVIDKLRSINTIGVYEIKVFRYFVIKK